MLKEFRKFILRGNVVDLAVGIVVGAAFNGVVQALVKDLVTPLLPSKGAHEFAAAYATFFGHRFMYGDFLDTLISFLLVAAAVFFLVVQPINKLNEISQRSKETSEPTTKKCPFCYSEINKKASRCAFCTAKLEAQNA